MRSLQAMRFFDEQLRAATEGDLRARWTGGKPGENFRCYLCGHRFKVGDMWRPVADNDGAGCGLGNFLVCATCDGPDVRARWHAIAAELRANRERFWWDRRSDDY